METFDIIDRIIAMIFTLGGLSMIAIVFYEIYYFIDRFFPEAVIGFKKWCNKLYD